MAINLGGGFHIGSKQPIDDRLVMTKAQMLNINENTFPDVYMCICNDDGAIYTFNINNESNDETGKFRIIEGSADCYTKAEIDTKLRPLLYEAPTIFITADQTNYPAGDVVDITFNVTIYAGNEKITRVYVNSWTKGVQELDSFSESGMTSTTVTYTEVSQTDVFTLTVKDEFKTTSTSLKINFAALSYCMLIEDNDNFDNSNYTMDDLFTYANTVESLALDSKEYKWYFGRDIKSEYICYCYPKEYGLLEIITDGGTNYISGFDRLEYTYNNVEYYCYIAMTASTLTDYGSLYMEFR